MTVGPERLAGDCIQLARDLPESAQQLAADMLDVARGGDPDPAVVRQAQENAREAIKRPTREQLRRLRGEAS